MNPVRVQPQIHAPEWEKELYVNESPVATQIGVGCWLVWVSPIARNLLFAIRSWSCSNVFIAFGTTPFTNIQQSTCWQWNRAFFIFIETISITNTPSEYWKKNFVIQFAAKNLLGLVRATFSSRSATLASLPSDRCASLRKIGLFIFFTFCPPFFRVAADNRLLLWNSEFKSAIFFRNRANDVGCAEAAATDQN